MQPTTRPAFAATRFAVLAALLLVGDGAIELLGGDTDDHMGGLGLLSEVVAGLAFLAGAAVLALLRPVDGWRGILWRLAPVGLTLAGVTMLGVPVIGEEPAGWLFVLAVLPTFVGTVACGVIGTGRVWRWWTGALVALLLPMMFTLPAAANGAAMALAWLAVAVAAGRMPADAAEPVPAG